MRWRPADLRPLAVTAGFSVCLVGTLGVAAVHSRSVPGILDPSTSADAVMVTGGSSRAGCTPLVAAVPQDDIPALAPLVLTYNHQNHLVGGRCVDVRLLAKSSGDTAAALGRGWDTGMDGPDQPQVWLPGASGWVSLLRASDSAQTRALIPDTTPSYAQSPLVIAMPRPMAEALGWPSRAIGFSDLIAIGSDPRGWGRVGHPEWGALRLGRTNPLLSTSGLNALVATYFAASGVSADLTQANVADPRVIAFVKAVELATVHYGDSSTAFLQSLQRADDAGTGLSYVSAIALEERQVLAYNEGDPGGDPAQLARHAPPRVPLAAVYPKEGTLISDYPFVVLNAPWVSSAQRDAAADLLQFLLSPQAQSRLVAAGYRDAHGRPGPALTPSAGLLPDHPTVVINDPPGSVLAALQSSWWSVRKPARVLVIVDTSGSMADDVADTGHTKLELVQAALTTALGRIGDNDEIGLWTFSDAQHEQVPIGRVGDHRAQLGAAVARMTPDGSTLLYATIQSALDAMTAHPDPGHIPAIVVLTDGGDTSSPPGSFDQLLKAEAAQPPNALVRVFTIAYGADADHGVLRQIADASQGTAYDASNPQLIQQVFNGVVSNF